jgi:hypothetical protein
MLQVSTQCHVTVHVVLCSFYGKMAGSVGGSQMAPSYQPHSPSLNFSGLAVCGEVL